MGMSGRIRDACSEILGVLLVPAPQASFGLSACEPNCCVHMSLHGESGKWQGRVGK